MISETQPYIRVLIELRKRDISQDCAEVGAWKHRKGETFVWVMSTARYKILHNYPCQSTSYHKLSPP